VRGIIREAIIAAALTGLMILVFLGSWRSTLIYRCLHSDLHSHLVIILGLIGETINTMTVGGLALAVGILVDDATVTIENIERYLSLPTHNGLYYGGAWHAPVSNRYKDTYNPATAELIGRSADGGKDDVNAAVEGAQRGFQQWRATPPLERGRIMRRIANMIRSHAQELALLDSAGGGNPVKEMTGDVMAAAAGWDFFAGLVTEMKGDSIPMGPDSVNFTVREPLGVVARIVAFNHPFIFPPAKPQFLLPRAMPLSSSLQSGRHSPP